MTNPEQGSPAEQAQFPDRVYRSAAGIAGGVLLLALAGWLGIDALVNGTGRTPWLALAGLILVVPLITSFTVRPAVYASTLRLRVRNPFRTITLPWSSVAALRSGYSNEVVDHAGTTYQLWAIPVSLRGRKKAARRQSRAAAHGEPAPRGANGRDEPIRSAGDQSMADLRELAERAEAVGPEATVEPSVRWAYEVIAPAAAGFVLLVVLFAAA